MNYTNFTNELRKIPTDEWIVNDDYSSFTHGPIEIKRRYTHVKVGFFTEFTDIYLLYVNDDHYNLDDNIPSERILSNEIKHIVVNVIAYQEKCKQQQEDIEKQIKQHHLDSFKYKAK
jgi:hypothetical protein